MSLAQDVDAACVDGCTKYVKGFLSEFGKEFEQYLRNAERDAKQKSVANERVGATASSSSI